MDLSGIISIAGMTGLYKAVAQTKNGLIVESIIDKKRIPTYASHKISALDEISIYTTSEDRPLKEVFVAIAEKINYGPAIEHKSSETELRKFFLEVLPDYDQERVHVSDIRKVVQWYSILQKNDLLKSTAKEEEKVDVHSPKLTGNAEDKAKPFKKAAVKTAKAKPTKSPAPKKTSTTRKSGAA